MVAISLIIALLCAVGALVYGVQSIQWVLSKDAGNARMQEIAAAIQEGARAVSYTHLDVYKRQRVDHTPIAVTLVEQRAVRVGRGGIGRVRGDHHDRMYLHPIRVQVHQMIMSGDGDR